MTAQRRILFFLFCVIGLCVAGRLDVSRADELKTKSGKIYAGKIKQVNFDGSVAIEVVDLGEIAINKPDIEWAKADMPAELPALLEAAANHDFAKAAQGLKPLVEKLAGLPEAPGGWVSNASLKLGESLRYTKQWAAAEALYLQMKTASPPKSQLARLAELGLAAVLAGRQKNGGSSDTPQLKITVGGTGSQVQVKMGGGDLENAMKIAGSFTSIAVGSLTVGPEDSALFARAYLVQGDCHAAAQKWKETITSYLTVTVLYYHDKGAVNEARYKAGQSYEALGDWTRAAEIYAELLKELPPQSVWREDVKKRISQAQEKSKSSPKS